MCIRLESLIVRRHLLPTRSSPIINIDNWRQSRDENGNQKVQYKETENSNNLLKTKVESEENFNGDKAQNINKTLINPIIHFKKNQETQNKPNKIEKKETTDYVGFSRYQSQKRGKRNKDLKISIAVLGEKGVGKSTIINTLLRSKISKISQQKSFTEYYVLEKHHDLAYHVNIIEFKGLYNIDVQVLSPKTKSSQSQFSNF